MGKYVICNIKGNPPRTTHQQKGVNFRTGGFYTKEKVQSAKDWYGWNLKKYAPDEPFTGAVAVSVAWHFELKSAKKMTPKTTRPDLDNLEKALFDVMTKLGFWKDDSQIQRKFSEKFDVPVGQGGLFVFVEELE